MDDSHRPIHEEALLHYFDPDKKEKKFVPEKKTEVAVTQVVPKQVCLCACQWQVPCEILATQFSKNLYSVKLYKMTTDDFAYILEQTRHLVFTNLGTENQNVTNSVIVIV